MDVNFYFSFNFPAVLMGLVAWGTIGLLAYRIYKKQTVKPAIWKVIIVIWVGIFSFTINWPMFDTLIKFPILPLGVWILYFILKRKEERWPVYRGFAWLGFYANFIFLVTTLLTIPIHTALYPAEKSTTYFGNIEEAAVVTIHPSGVERILNTESLVNQLQTMVESSIYSEEWYAETYMEGEPKQERFPYLLTHTTAKWGSGLQTMVYIENDGKGILITTPKRQVYFRTEASLLKEET